MGTARWTYNTYVATVQNERVAPTKKALRVHVLYAAAFAKRPMPQGKTWVLETPFDVNDEAINDLLKAHQAQLAKTSTNFTNNFQVYFRSMKDEVQSIAVLAEHYNNTKSSQFAFLKRVHCGGKEALPS